MDLVQVESRLLIMSNVLAVAALLYFLLSLSVVQHVPFFVLGVVDKGSPSSPSFEKIACKISNLTNFFAKFPDSKPRFQIPKFEFYI